VADLHSLQYILNPFLPVAGLHLKIDQGELNIFIDIEFINQVKALEDETDIPFSENCPVPFLQVGNLRAIEDITP